MQKQGIYQPVAGLQSLPCDSHALHGGFALA